MSAGRIGINGIQHNLKTLQMRIEALAGIGQDMANDYGTKEHDAFSRGCAHGYRVLARQVERLLDEVGLE